MSGQGFKPKWGSLLSQAVAGVEARLDNILAEEDTPKPTPSPTPSQQPKPPGMHIDMVIALLQGGVTLRMLTCFA